MTRASLMVATLLLVLSACNAAPPAGSLPEDNTNSGDGPPERVFGTIEYYEQSAKITLPATAEVGKPFAVTVVTYGDGCTEKGETDVELQPLRAEIRPYDYNVAPGSVCADTLTVHEHTEMLAFTLAGRAEIVLYGQRATSSGRTNTTVTRTLEVADTP